MHNNNNSKIQPHTNNRSMQRTNNKMKLEKKEKLNWQEKIIVKVFTRKAKKAIKNYKEKIEETIKEREQWKKAIKDLQEVFEIENEKGETLTEADLETMTIKEMVETVKEAIEELERMI